MRIIIGLTTRIKIILKISIIGILSLLIVTQMFPSIASASVEVVTFAENANLNDSITATEGASQLTSLTSFINLVPAFSNPGYSFDGWTTNQDGSGTYYADGAPYNFVLGNMVLWAQWIPNHVTFIENASASDATSAEQVSSIPTALTLFSDISPSFAKVGYNFIGWSTSPGGAGTSYLNGATYDFTLGSTTLYAQWDPATYTVGFDPEGGNVSATSASFTTGAAPLTLPVPTQSGFTFNGWFTAPQGGSLVGTGGAPFTPTASTTLYAQWITIPIFNVTFSANGGSGTVDAITGLSGSLVSLPSPGSMSRPGYEFIGWNSAADGSGTSISPSGTLSLSGPLTLFAQWRSLPAVTITFALNGAPGTMKALSTYDGAIETLPVPPTLARPGFIFTGWNTRADGTGTIYAGGVTMTMHSSLTLFAQWSGHAPARLASPIGPFASAESRVTGPVGAQVSRLAALVIREGRKVVTLYGYVSNAATPQAQRSEGRARVNAVATALRRDLAHAHHGGVRVVAVYEGSAAGSSDRVSVVVR